MLLENSEARDLTIGIAANLLSISAIFALVLLSYANFLNTLMLLSLLSCAVNLLGWVAAKFVTLLGLAIYLAN